MQVSVETTQGLERRLSITVPAEQIDNQVKEQLKRLAKTQRIDGFRPGKVPVSVIKKRFGAQVRQDVANEEIQKKFYEAVMQEKLNPAGFPAINIEALKEGEDFAFSATFEVYPELKVEGLDQLKVEKATAEIKPEDLDAMLDTLRKQHASWAEVEREIADGDRADINFVGSVDGEEFEGGKADNFPLEIGGGRMIPGFEEGVIGLKAGDEKEVNVTFPEDYQAENLKGKEAVFKITVNKVEEQALPEIDDEFCQKFGVEEGGLDALKAEVGKNMERELTNALKVANKQSVLSALNDSVEVDLPKALIDQEIETLRKQALERFGNQGAENLELPGELFEAEAKNRVKTGLVIGEVIKTNEIKPEDSKVEEIIASTASAYEDPKEVIEYYKSNEQLLTNIRNLAVEEQAVEFVLAQAQVEEVSKSFDEVMNKQA